MTMRDALKFRGVYHHWDSYPSGLGRRLFRLWNTHFKGDTEAMLRVLIDSHPAGWSTVVEKDFDLRPGWCGSKGQDPAGNRPQCYCHADRHEKGWQVSESNAAGSGVEYVYAFSGSKMLILGSFCDDGSKMVGMFGSGDPNAVWRILAEVDLAGAQPDWDVLDERSYPATQ